MTSGIHHLTLITRDVQANVDFYAGFLGLRLVKQTGGYEDAEQLHLFYGDRLGTPGSLITFLVWQDGSPGRVGHGQVSEIALAVPPASIGFWLTRALTRQVPIEGPRQEFGEPVLRVRDPDGVVVKLVGTEMPAAAPWASPGIEPGDAVLRLRGATILSETPEETAHFIGRFGYEAVAKADGVQRLVSESGDVVDVREAAGFWPGAPGTGMADHVAFRAQDVEAVIAAEASLARLNSSITNRHDRKYFTSLYVREPGGTLIELATDGPGFTIDESEQELGATLMVPPSDTARAEAIRVMLPQFALPGEPRPTYRDLPFVHRFHVPAEDDGSTLVLLHGTGGNEADLMPLAHRVAPQATLLGLRGRSTEEGTARWFRRFGEGKFDQGDIRAEAAAFAAFVEEASRAYGLDPARTTWLGYSNGANFLAAAMRLHPDLIRRTVLLRPVDVLEEQPAADLWDSATLIVAGEADPYAPGAEALREALRKAGGHVDLARIDAGHALSEADAGTIKAWLAQR
ncbi:glyoxalase [Bosea sp. WAO]|uniref:VOC family protein n=1 Tax=Bosea sp. WAO TaxID=406341 RepID=UPI0007482E34|nr:VOC family protein [Bosea sp. WAO]KUL94135.1 glyoxalase [Bosea sp. WAO]